MRDLVLLLRAFCQNAVGLQWKASYNPPSCCLQCLIPMVGCLAYFIHLLGGHVLGTFHEQFMLLRIAAYLGKCHHGVHDTIPLRLMIFQIR